MHTDKPLPREHVNVSIEHLSEFVELAAVSVQLNPATEWIFNSCSYKALIGNHDISTEGRILRAAIVVFSQDTFSRYVHARMFENIFESNEVYNAFWYKRETFYPKVYAVLSVSESLATKAQEMMKQAYEDRQVSLLSKKVELIEPEPETPKQSSGVISHEEFMQMALTCTARESQKYFRPGFSEEEIKSGSRKREVVFCRRIIMQICTEKCIGLSQGALGNFLG